jgi:hypothetical protein
VKKIIFTPLLILAPEIAFAMYPPESLVLSCLKSAANSRSITVRELSTHEFQEEDDYAEGFNAPYFLSTRVAMSDMRKAKKLMHSYIWESFFACRAQFLLATTAG